MKQTGFLIALVSFCWLFISPKALAQNPYHCDSLKVTCSGGPKIKVRYYNAPKSCPETCGFCQAITRQDWLQVQTDLRKHSKNLSTSPEQLKQYRTWLLAHKKVNFVLPPETEAFTETASNMQIGFQVPYMTYTWNVAFKPKKARKTKQPYWKFYEFRSDGQIYSRLNAKGAIFQALLKSDSMKLPAPWLPDQNYTASWYGTRQPTEIAELESRFKNNPREAVKLLTEAKDGIGLALLMAHENLAIRYLALQGIKTIQDKNCLPYLLYLSERIRHGAEATPETQVLYANYCEQLVATISILTNCNFNRCPYAHYPAQHYLNLGQQTWIYQIDHQDPNNQGIGMYGTLLSE